MSSFRCFSNSVNAVIQKRDNTEAFLARPITMTHNRPKILLYKVVREDRQQSQHLLVRKDLMPQSDPSDVPEGFIKRELKCFYNFKNLVVVVLVWQFSPIRVILRVFKILRFLRVFKILRFLLHFQKSQICKILFNLCSR